MSPRVGISGPRVMGHRTHASTGTQWPVALAILAAVCAVEVLAFALKIIWRAVELACRGVESIARRMWAAHEAVKPYGNTNHDEHH